MHFWRAVCVPLMKPLLCIFFSAHYTTQLHRFCRILTEWPPIICPVNSATFDTEMVTNCCYLVNIEILSEEGALLRGRLSAVIGQNLSEGYYSFLWLAKSEGLTADCEVDVVLCQRPAPLLINLHGLAVTAQCMPPLHETTVERERDRRSNERGCEVHEATNE